MKDVLKYGTVLMSAIALAGCCNDNCKKQEATCCTATTELTQEQAVMDNILSRRSIRNYTTEPVNREQMAKVLECGIYAPNAMNAQTWAVRVVDAPDFIEGITKIAVEANPSIAEQEGFRNIFRNAPTVAFVAAPEQSYSGEYDCGLLSENMMLAAWSMGIGSCCLGSIVPIMQMEEAKPYMERLQLPEGYKLLVGIAFGYPEGDTPQAPERDASKAYYVE